MAKKRERVKTLDKKDPAVEELQAQAASNIAALSKKEQAELQRTRVYYDVPPWLKSAGEQAAAKEETSASQLAAFLLAWALRLYRQGDGEMLEALRDSKIPSRSLRISWNVEIPTEVKKTVTSGAI